MAVKLTTTKCGHCGITWEYRSLFNMDSIVGPPFIKCRTCGGMNKTDSNVYKKLNLFGKIYFIVGKSVSLLIYGLFFVGLVISFITNLETFPIIPSLIILLLAFSVPAYHFLTLKKSIKKLDDMVENNGGFVWSDEVYEK